MSNDELEKLLAIAQKTQGWNFREYPPQYAQLTGGCELIVLSPVLWRGYRCNPRPKEPCELLRMPRRLCAVRAPSSLVNGCRHEECIPRGVA